MKLALLFFSGSKDFKSCGEPSQNNREKMQHAFQLMRVE
jgi:hypothetical protein